MPTYISLGPDGATLNDDRFTTVADDQPTPEGDVIISFSRFQTEGDALLSQGRSVGVWLSVDQSVEDLAYDLPRLAVVALSFPKFRDGRAYTQAWLLRERFKFNGQIRAIGDVLREQAGFMVRCGFDAFEPADGSTPDQWLTATHRFRHVYQRSADDREPIFQERARARDGAIHAL